MLKKILACTVLLFIILSVSVSANTKCVIDNAKIFKDESILIENSEKFFINYNINLYYYTVEKSTQEEFERVMSEYKSSAENEFVLFYIIKDTGNVGIYTSEELSVLITDVNKIVLLKSMETDFANGEFEKAMICASNNLSEIIDDYNESKIENEKLDLDLENKNKQQTLSIIGMIVFAGIFVGGLIFLFKDSKKENNKENKEIINNKMRKQ